MKTQKDGKRRMEKLDRSRNTAAGSPREGGGEAREGARGATLKPGCTRRMVNSLTA